MTRTTTKAEGAIRQALKQRHTPANGYLGDPVVVNGLFRALAQQFNSHVEAVAEGRMTSAAVRTADQDELNRLTQVFLGNDARYAPVGSWNTGYELARSLRAKLDLPPNPDDDPNWDVFHALVTFFHAVYGVLTEAIHGNIEAEEAGARINALIERYTRLFIGLPEGA